MTFNTISISSKITTINLVIFLILGLSILFAGKLLLESDELQQLAKDRQKVNIRVAWSNLKQLGDNYYIQGDKLYAGSHLLNGNNDFVDNIKETVGGTATIFMRDVRVATNVKNKKGGRAIGTKLAKGPVYDAIFKQKKSFRGEADILGKSYYTAYDPILDASGDVIGILYVGVNKDEFFAPIKKNFSIIIFMVIIFGFLLCLINYFLARKFVSVPIEQACSVISGMSKGYLNIDLHDTEGDEISELYNSFHRMQVVLTDVIEGIRSGAIEVSRASEQIAMGNNDLSQRTQEQVSSQEEIASSMEEMMSVVHHTSENATHANKLVNSSREQAELGGEIAAKAVDAMEAIDKSCNKIAEIISLIDEISFQTNLLALNASVEAAHAGDHGRGFAIVAGEVRNLAEKSKSAAQDIKKLIEDSLTKVHNGTKLVEESNTALDEIITSVKQASEMVSDIALSSKEQSEGIKQVNISISRMDEMTQRNASLVEEATAASEAMGAQAEELTSLVSYFKLN